MQCLSALFVGLKGFFDNYKSSYIHILAVTFCSLLWFPGSSSSWCSIRRLHDLQLSSCLKEYARRCIYSLPSQLVWTRLGVVLFFLLDMLLVARQVVLGCFFLIVYDLNLMYSLGFAQVMLSKMGLWQWLFISSTNCLCLKLMCLCTFTYE